MTFIPSLPPSHSDNRASEAPFHCPTRAGRNTGAKSRTRPIGSETLRPLDEPALTL
jgi:hypothetical protein